MLLMMLPFMASYVGPASAEMPPQCAVVDATKRQTAAELGATANQFPYFSMKTPKDWREFSRGYFLRQASENDRAGVWLHASPDHTALEIAKDLENIFDADYKPDRDCSIDSSDVDWRVRFARSDDQSFAIAHADVNGVGYAVLVSGDQDDAILSLTANVLLPMLSSFEPLTPDASNADIVTVFITRHAEKDKSVEGTPLTVEGEERAKLLSTMLKASDITAVYATIALRTQQTAAPLAARLDLDVEIADVTKLSEFADGVLEDHEGETVLIVSHSHTIPALLEHLGVSNPPFILESEYDNLYVVYASQDGEAYFSRLKFGTTSSE